MEEVDLTASRALGWDSVPQIQEEPWIGNFHQELDY